MGVVVLSRFAENGRGLGELGHRVNDAETHLGTDVPLGCGKAVGEEAQVFGLDLANQGGNRGQPQAIVLVG